MSKGVYRPISDIRCPDLADPKLPVESSHRHPLEAPLQRAHIGRQYSGRLRRTASSGRTNGSACSPPPTPSASATPRACTTAPSRSIRVRWTAEHRHLDHDVEAEIVAAKVPEWQDADGGRKIAAMVRVDDMTGNAFINGDISTVMSPRTVMT